MTLAAALVIYALLTAAVAPLALGRASWLSRSPRLGVLAWQAVLAAVFSSLVLLIVVAVVPTEALTFDVQHVLHACVVRFSELAARGEFGHGRLAAAAVGAGTAGRLVWVLVVEVRALRRQRRGHRLLLDLLAGEPRADGTVVLPAGVPAAYCVPGDGGRIVLTTAAEASLDPAQRRAVVAHERAHLRGHHDLVLLGADVAAASLPRSRFLAQARLRLTTYVEMMADDAAVRLAGREQVLAALLGMGRIEAAGTLPASGTSMLERIVRLLEPAPRTPSRTGRALFATGFGAVAVLPVLAVAAPLWAAAAGLCAGS